MTLQRAGEWDKVIYPQISQIEQISGPLEPGLNPRFRYTPSFFICEICGPFQMQSPGWGNDDPEHDHPLPITHDP
jgi:hypothetical protein